MYSNNFLSLHYVYCTRVQYVVLVLYSYCTCDLDRYNILLLYLLFYHVLGLRSSRCTLRVSNSPLLLVRVRSRSSQVESDN